MKRPLLFAELCAGTAAVSLKLQGGRHARPPVSRMGAKTGYGEALLKVMGLRCGLGAKRYLWCDPDPGVRLLLEAYRDHDLALKAAEIIRGWKDEEPRALWERLKAEGPVREPEPREVARWIWTWGRSYNTKGPNAGFLPSHSAKGVEVWNAHQPEYFGDRIEQCPTLPADIHPDATQIDPREVARWLTVQARTYGQAVAWGPGGGTTYMEPAKGGGRCGPTAATLPGRLSAAPTLPAFILPAAVYPMPRFPEDERVIAYMDPPYRDTTGYGHDLPRAEVVRLARAWADAGADVYISEAEPIGALVEDGWHTVEITDTRKGQKRTFSAQKREFLTCSRAPAWTPGSTRQRALFGVEA